MGSELLYKISSVNSRLAGLLEGARNALRGEHDFGTEEVRSISELASEMEAVMTHAAEMRERHPEISGGLDLYTKQLAEIQVVLEQIRVMLLARRGQMDAGRAQLEAVTGWTARLQQTR